MLHSMKVIDLTHTIRADMPVYPGTEPPILAPANTYEQDGFKETRLTLFTHTGTHADPPAHLFPGRTTLDQFPAEQFIGKALVIDCRDLGPGEAITLDRLGRYGGLAEQADFLLFHLGWDRFWGTNDYFGDYPCLDDEVLDLLAGVAHGDARSLLNLVEYAAALPEDKRNLEQIKTASITITDTLPAYKHLEGVTVNIAVTSGLAGSDILLNQIAAGESPYHFIEVMGCPGGCISGGGQPRSDVDDFRTLRTKALYTEDEGKPLRKSHENPDLMKLYETYLGEPGGHRAHELLHTHYVPRGLYNELVK